MTELATQARCYAFLDGSKVENNVGKISWTNLARNGSDNLGGNISPSSDSGLGSEEEEQSALYENIPALQSSSSKTLSELTKTLTIKCDTEIVEDKIAYTCQDSDDSDSSVSLSLLLTTQNPSRIDVRTLRKNKVSGRQGECQQLSKYWEINKQYTQ